jgi:hypothetical protein
MDQSLEMSMKEAYVNQMDQSLEMFMMEACRCMVTLV